MSSLVIYQSFPFTWFIQVACLFIQLVSPLNWHSIIHSSEVSPIELGTRLEIQNKYLLNKQPGHPLAWGCRLTTPTPAQGKGGPGMASLQAASVLEDVEQWLRTIIPLLSVHYTSFKFLPCVREVTKVSSENRLFEEGAEKISARLPEDWRWKHPRKRRANGKTRK